MKEINILSASETHREGIVQLLEEASLPTQDLPEQLTHFLIAQEKDTIIGVVGLELFNSVALLRSLAVAASHRGSGLGQALHRRAVALAAERQIQTVYLLTTTADGFFEKQGFERVDRSSAPAFIQRTTQFSGVCPSSAIVMSLAIPSK